MNYQEDMASKMQSLQTELDFYKRESEAQLTQLQHKVQVKETEYQASVSGQDSYKGQLEVCDMKIKSLMAQLEHLNITKSEALSELERQKRKNKTKREEIDKIKENTKTYYKDKCRSKMERFTHQCEKSMSQKMTEQDRKVRESMAKKMERTHIPISEHESIVQ